MSEIRSKRFAESELAAEFHRAVSSFQAASSLDDLFSDPHSWYDLERDRGWMFAMERFATLPSYDEARS